MDKPELFQIGTVAKLFHLSVSSLRHYEDIGLLKPEYVSPESGYRYYSARQFEVLSSIRYLRALDLPLPEIADFLKNKDVDRIEEKLRQQKQAVIERQQALQRVERRIDNRLRQLESAQHARARRDHPHARTGLPPVLDPELAENPQLARHGAADPPSRGDAEGRRRLSRQGRARHHAGEPLRRGIRPVRRDFPRA